MGPSFHCFRYYDLDKLPSSELQALQDLKQKSRIQLRQSWMEERKSLKTPGNQQKGGRSLCEDLSDGYTLADLKIMAKEEGLRGVSNLRKDELCRLLAGKLMR